MTPQEHLERAAALLELLEGADLADERDRDKAGIWVQAAIAHTRLADELAPAVPAVRAVPPEGFTRVKTDHGFLVFLHLPCNSIKPGRYLDEVPPVKCSRCPGKERFMSHYAEPGAWAPVYALTSKPAPAEEIS